MFGQRLLWLCRAFSLHSPNSHGDFVAYFTYMFCPGQPIVNDLVCVSFSMLLLSILIRGSVFPSASSFCRDPIIMNSVFAMFKLNLFALSQQLRLFSSAFIEGSRSV